MAKKPEPALRALWTFLGTTLVAPFLAALVVMMAAFGLAASGRGPSDLLAMLDAGAPLASAARAALAAFVWSALPAGLAGAALALLVWRQGSLSVLAAAIAGAVAATLFAVLGGGVLTRYLTAIAFLGAVATVAVRQLLVRARIVAAE